LYLNSLCVTSQKVTVTECSIQKDYKCWCLLLDTSQISKKWKER
jgi:hypothetical protein